MLANALRWIRSVFFTIPLIVAVTIIMGTVALAASLAGSRAGPMQGLPDMQDRSMRWWARMVLSAGLVRWSVRNLEKIDPSRTYVFCANHLSYLDPPLVLASLENRVRFLAKKSLFWIPFLGWAMRGAGHVAIDRENARAALRSLHRAAGEVRAGTSVIVFPEGGRSLDGRLQPFRSGGFRLAVEAQAPVVPLAIVGTRQVLPRGSLNIRGGRVQLLVGDPISTEGLTAKDSHELAARVREAMEKMLWRAGEGGAG